MSSIPESSDMSYKHKEDNKYFTEAFATFDELRKNNVMTDVVLMVSEFPEMILNNDGDTVSVNENNASSQNKVKASKVFISNISL